MNKNSTKNFKVLALILLTSALLISAINTQVPLAKAATTDSVYVYSTIGGSVSANGTAAAGGSSLSYANGDVVTFSQTASAGFNFLGWIYVTPSGAVTSAASTVTETISASGCAIEAIFIPTTNAVQSSSGSGTATIALYFTVGGTTVPSSLTSTPPITYTNYTIGESATFTAVPASGFNFLFWMVVTSTSSTYTSSTLTLNIPQNTCAMEAIFVPTSSTLTLPTPTPTINEFSTATTLAMVIAIVAVAFGTYTYTKKAKK